MKKIGLPLAILAVVLIILWMTGAAREETATPKKDAKPQPVQTMEGIKLEGGGTGGAKWTLTAQSAISDAAGEMGSLTGVGITYEGKSGLVTGKAGKAEKLGTGGAFQFSGGVEIHWRDLAARTPKAVYDPVKGIITTDEKVEITFDRGSISGTGLRADLGSSSAKIIANSSAKITGASR